MGKTRGLGVALVVVGLVTIAGFFFISKGFTPDLGLRWNIRQMEVVLKNKVTATYMDIRSFRMRYPEYNDIDAQDLSMRLHTKFFSGMTLEDYRSHFLGAAMPVETLPQDRAGGDPIMIRWPLKELKVTDPYTRTVMTSDAIEYGLIALTLHRVAFPYRYPLFAGLGLLAAGLTVLALSGKKGYNS